MRLLALLLACLSLPLGAQTPPFSGLTLTSWWTLGYPTGNAPLSYSSPYLDLIGGNNLSMVLNMSTGNSVANFNVGANNAGGQTGSSTFAHFGIWSRALTTAEHNDLAGGDVCAGSSPCSYTLTSLNTGLKCYWAFGDGSGTGVHYTDTSGNSCPDLVDTAASVQVVGPNGVGDHGTAYTGGGYATSSHNSKTDPGSGAYSSFIAVNMASLSGSQANFNCQIDLVAGNDAVCTYYQGAYSSGNKSFNTDQGNGGDFAHSGVVVNCALGDPSINTWYALGYSYNPVSSYFGVQTLYVNGTSNGTSFDRTINLSFPFAFPGASTCYSSANISSWDCASSYVGPGLQVASPTSAIGFSSSSRTWGLWINAAGVSGGTQTLAGTISYNGTLNVVNWGAQISSGQVYLLSGNSTTTDFQYCNTTITNGAHFLLYYYDASGPTQHAYLDNVAFGTCGSVAHTPTLGTLPFIVGANTNTSNTPPMGQPAVATSSVDRMFFANGIPTAGDRTLLYNGGTGYVYSPPGAELSVIVLQ